MYRDLVEKIMVLNELKEEERIRIEDLVHKIGFTREYLINVVSNLARNFIIHFDQSVVEWASSDNPSRFRPWGWKLEHRILAGSGLDIVKKYGSWSIVVVEYQTVARGRHGKEWLSDLGGLWASYRMPVSQTVAKSLPLLVPIVIIDTLRENLGVETKIRWPNDIVYGDKKIAGILVEAEFIHDRLIVNVGIGLNVNNEPPLPGTTSLKKIMGKLVPRNAILASLTGRINRLMKLSSEPEELEKKFRENLVTLGRRIRVETVNEVFEAIAVDIEENGDLVVKTNGVIKKLDPLRTIRIKHLD